MADLRTTPRGFIIYGQVTDTHGNEIRVQESSSATDYCVWIFCSDTDASPHLDVEQAKQVRDALDTFIRAGDSDEA